MAWATTETLIGGGLVILGLAVTWLNISYARANLRFASLAKAAGVVERCEMIEVSGKRPGREGVSPVHRYHLDLCYRFEVDGKTVEGTRLRFGTLTGVNDPEWARTTAERLKPGTEVTVHYDPNRPKWCALEPGERRGWWIGLATGLAFLVGGLVMLSSR